MLRGDTAKEIRGELDLSPEVDNNIAVLPRRIASESEIDWGKVRRVLVIRLRSIGDTVLATPSLIALRRFLPNAQIDILLEDWVAPLLDGFDAVDNVISIPKSSASRIKTAWRLRKDKYEVVFNLHGGTTGTFFTFASGAQYRVGYTEYQYNFLYNHLLTSAADFWKQETTHSAEQQLALLGFIGVPVDDKPRSKLCVTTSATESLNEKFYLKTQKLLSEFGQYALFHPAAAFETKRWATQNFARTSEFLHEKGLRTIAVATKLERGVLDDLQSIAGVAIITFDDLTLPEITALASKARLFVGNDSGIAHIAAAVQTSSLVIFGSSNSDHWRPWTNAPSEIVYEEYPCQPCAGYECKEFGVPLCINNIKPAAVFKAIDKVLAANKKGEL